MPGVQKHFTDVLDNIEARGNGKEKLLNTIRCPLNLGAVTNLMPASNYNSNQQPKIKEPAKEVKPEPTPSEADRTSSSRISVLYSKPAPRDVTVNDKDEQSRLHSAQSNQSRSSEKAA